MENNEIIAILAHGFLNHVLSRATTGQSALIVPAMKKTTGFSSQTERL